VVVLIILFIKNFKVLIGPFKGIKKEVYILLIIIFLISFSLRFYYSSVNVFGVSDFLHGMTARDFSEGSNIKYCENKFLDGCNYYDKLEHLKQAYPIGYPFIVSFWFRLTEPTLDSMLLFNILISSISILAIFFLSYLVCKKIIPSITSALFLTFLHSHILVKTFDDNAFSLFVILIFMISLIITFKKKSMDLMIFDTFLFIFLVFIRLENISLFIPLIFVFFKCFKWKDLLKFIKWLPLVIVLSLSLLFYLDSMPTHALIEELYLYERYNPSGTTLGQLIYLGSWIFDAFDQNNILILTLIAFPLFFWKTNFKSKSIFFLVPILFFLLVYFFKPEDPLYLFSIYPFIIPILGIGLNNLIDFLKFKKIFRFLVLGLVFCFIFYSIIWSYMEFKEIYDGEVQETKRICSYSELIQGNAIVYFNRDNEFIRCVYADNNNIEFYGFSFNASFIDDKLGEGYRVYVAGYVENSFKGVLEKSVTPGQDSTSKEFDYIKLKKNNEKDIFLWEIKRRYG